MSFGGERLINGIAWGRDNGNSVDTGQTGGYPTGQYADRWINT